MAGHCQLTRTPGPPRPDEYNLDGAGDSEIFLVLWCKDQKSDPTGTLVEVILGGQDPATTQPTKLMLQLPGRVAGRPCFVDRTASFRVSAGGASKMYQTRWPDKATEPVRLAPATTKPDCD